MKNLRKYKGQSLAEYGLILALIAIVCIAALTFLGGQISTSMNNLANQLFGAVTQASAQGG